jgi:hypothetical protein
MLGYAELLQDGFYRIRVGAEAEIDPFEVSVSDSNPSIPSEDRMRCRAPALTEDREGFRKLPPSNSSNTRTKRGRGLDHCERDRRHAWPAHLGRVGMRASLPPVPHEQTHSCRRGAGGSARILRDFPTVADYIVIEAEDDAMHSFCHKVQGARAAQERILTVDGQPTGIGTIPPR